MTQNRKKILVWLLPISVAIAIFYFSSQPSDESSQLSNSVIKIILDFINRLNLQIDIEHWMEILSLPIRKLAHMTEYAVFFIALLIAFSVNEIKNRLRPILSMMIVFLYACTDEFHQTFVPGRYGCFTDVLIDCTIAGIFTILFMINSTSKK